MSGGWEDSSSKCFLPTTDVRSQKDAVSMDLETCDCLHQSTIKVNNKCTFRNRKINLQNIAQQASVAAHHADIYHPLLPHHENNWNTKYKYLFSYTFSAQTLGYPNVINHWKPVGFLPRSTVEKSRNITIITNEFTGDQLSLYKKTLLINMHTYSPVEKDMQIWQGQRLGGVKVCDAAVTVFAENVELIAFICIEENSQLENRLRHHL